MEGDLGALSTPPPPPHTPPSIPTIILNQKHLKIDIVKNLLFLFTINCDDKSSLFYSFLFYFLLVVLVGGGGFQAHPDKAVYPIYLYLVTLFISLVH